MSLNNLSSSNSNEAFLDYGEFRSGVFIQTSNQILYFTNENGIKIGYQWKGLLPHTTNTNDPNTDGGISDTAWCSVVSTGFFEKLSNEGINLDWRAHLPTVEVSYNLPHKSLKVWTAGVSSTENDYWLYADGTVWNGTGILGITPDIPFKQLVLQNNIIEWSSIATEGQNQFTVPYEFTNISVFINGLLQNKSAGGYVVNGSTVTLNGSLKAGDDIHVVISNVQVSDLDYVLESQINSSVGASNIGTSYGVNIQRVINEIGTIVSSVNDLSSLIKYNGQIARTQSYYSGTNKGGGIYIYDQSQSSINNGVSIINGWVRIFSDIKTASDAGIKESMSSSDATSRLNQLLSVVNDGDKIDLENIVINLNTHARIVNKNNIEIFNFILKGDKNNWQFVNNDRGMLIASYCNNIDIHHGQIQGVRISQPNTIMTDTITSTGRIQDGDAGIELKYCNSPILRYNVIHGVKTWGIISTNGNNPTAHNNTVYDCARQSGISLVIGTTNDVNDVYIYNNTIYNVGLYGVEVEKHTKVAKRIHIFDNNISNCQYGINLVGSVSEANVHDNNIYGCYYAMAGTSLNNTISTETLERNYFKHNQAYANFTGIAPSNSYYVTYQDNLVNGLRTNNFFITNPYNTVEIVASNNSFYSLRTITAGTKLSINDVICTVISSTAITDTTITQKIGLTTVYLIVVDVLPTGLEDYTPFKLESPSDESYGYYSFYLPNVSEHLYNNIFENVKYGFYQKAATSSNNDCFALGTTINNTTYPVSGATYGMRVSKSKLINCSRYTDSLGKLTYNIIGIKQINTISYNSPITSGATKPTVNFYNYNNDIAVRARVIVNNVSWTTSATSINLGLTLNGNTVGYINVTSKGVNVDSFIDFITNGLLLTGANTIRIVDTTGSLSFDNWSVELFVAD